MLKVTFWVVAVSITSLIFPGNVLALPELDLQKSVIVGTKALQYMPDSADPNAFYFLPDDMVLAKDENGNLRFGFQHWGITRADPAGVGGNVVFTIRPSWDAELVAKATQELKKTNPNASLAPVPIAKSYFDVIISNTFASDATYVTPPQLLDDYTIKFSQTLKDLGITPDKNSLGDQAKNVLESVAGSSGTGPQAFTVPLNGVGGRLSVETPDVNFANFIGTRYRFMVKGVTPKFRAELTVWWKKTYTHFQHQASGGFWFFRGSDAIDIQKMTQDGSIELKIVSGAVDDKSETLLNSIFEALVNARINGTGMFQPQLRPSALGGGGDGNPLGGFSFGWGFNTNNGFQYLEENLSQKFIIDKQDIQHRAYSIGVSFGRLCSANRSYFVNLSQPSRPCPSDNDIQNFLTRIDTCWTSHAQQIEFAKTQDPPVKEQIYKQVTKICGG